MKSPMLSVAADERVAMASHLLRLLTVAGIAVAVGDFFTGSFRIASAAVGIAVAGPVILLLSRQPRFEQLPLQLSHWLLFLMFAVGVIMHLPFRPERLAWMVMFPVAYFYLGGLRLGLLLTSLSLLISLSAYFAAPWLHGKPVTLGLQAYLHGVGVFVFIAILSYLYESVRNRQALRLQSLAEHDTLTNLLNRRGFLSRAGNLREQSIRFGDRYAVVLLDVDDFKRVNDRHGHAAGDALLARIAGLLTQSTRKADLLARWGGEEFILLLPQTDMDHACGAAEKIRARISAEALSQEPVTVSAGVALQQAPETLEATINRADRAMYRAKEAGKNRVVCE